MRPRHIFDQTPANLLEILEKLVIQHRVPVTRLWACVPKLRPGYNFATFGTVAWICRRPRCGRDPTTLRAKTFRFPDSKPVKQPMDAQPRVRPPCAAP